MNDETKAALERFRKAGTVADSAVQVAVVFHIDGEQARSDARAEEVREACARQFPKGPEESFFDPWAAEVVRATPLTSTPLADRIAELEASVRVSESLLRVTTAERDEAEARVAELEADIRAGVVALDEARARCNGLGCGHCEACLIPRAEKAEGHAEEARQFFRKERELRQAAETRVEELAAERDALRAQVEAARRWAVHDSHGRGLVDVMDEAKPRQG